MLKYALRYAPLLILALLVIFFHSTNGKQPAIRHETLQTPLPGSVLYGVSMLSAQDAWAVGGTFTRQRSTTDPQKTGSTIPGAGLILHYTANNGWQPDNIESNLTKPLLAVALDSPHDGWAVGYNATFVHYNGNAWSPVAGPPNFNKNVVSVAALSPSDAWAVGYGGAILHYDGKLWTLVVSPTMYDLLSIAMPSAQEGWAVGDNGTLLHFSHGSWHSSPSSTSNRLNNVVMFSANEGWTVGNNNTILHYRDGIWGRVSLSNAPLSGTLMGIAMNSVRSGWIIGDQYILTYQEEIWTLQKPISYSNNNQQYIPPKYHDLYSIALSASGQGWAVGRIDNGNGSSTLLILHYQNNTWSPFSINAQ